MSEKLSCDLEVGSANFGCFQFLWLRSFTISAAIILKNPCAIELNKVTPCLGLYSFEIVLYSLTISVRVAGTKRNVEKYIPH